MQSLCELNWVSTECGTLNLRSEVVEEVIVQDAVLHAVCAVDKLLLYFPAYWAHVAELAD